MNIEQYLADLASSTERPSGPQKPWLNKHSGCVEYVSDGKIAAYAEWIDDNLTILRAFDDNRILGVQVSAP